MLGVRCSMFAFFLLLSSVVLYFFPLFRIVSLETALAEKKAETFDPKTFAERFWKKELPASAENAIDIRELAAALAADPEAAKAKHGRTMGLGNVHYFHVRGSGTVMAVNEGKTVSLSVDSGDAVQVEFPTGIIFSNALRDSTGLIKVSNFASSRHFNDISSELNKLVEAEVLPTLREKAAPGVRLSFVGCAETAGEGKALPLTVIPVQLNIEEEQRTSNAQIPTSK